MKPLTREWVEKAEADFRTAARERRVRSGPNYDAVCFHVQQCTEKYLKARLHEAGVSFPKTHNLHALLDCVLVAEPLWETLRDDLGVLNVYAVPFRYPGESADKEIAVDALQICRRLRKAMREGLGLTP